MDPKPVPPQIAVLERPCPALWKYYLVTAMLTGPGILVMLPYLAFRYHTLRYRFDAEGIHMRVGLLFRREVNLTYARIQDIHLHSNFVQRWLGLANIQIQTASGSAGAELVIEGFKEFESIRDFLYTRMRGYQAQPDVRPSAAPHPGALAGSTEVSLPTENAEMISLLLNIRDELRRTREALESRKPSSSASSPSSPA